MRIGAVLRLTLPAIAMLAVGGCGDRTNPTGPTATVRESGAQIARTQAMATGFIVKRTTNISDDIVVTRTITPEGGWIAVDSAGLYVYFPKYAVATDLVVTVTAHKGNKVVYSFEPHGTQFAQPVYVAQLLRYTELNTPRNKNRVRPWGGYMPDGLADVNDDGTGNFAEIFDAQFYGKGNDTYALFATTHFSGYALASGRAQPTQ